MSVSGEAVASPWRRVAAFGIDYLVIALYMGLLLSFNLSLGSELIAWVQAPWQGQLLGFTMLTLPVTLYFALSEASRWQGTIGKGFLGLVVVTRAGERVPLPRSLLRSAVKFLPWELSHTALHRLVFWSAEAEQLAIWQVGFLVITYSLSLLGAGWYVLSLFLRDRSTPYDRLAGTQVCSPQLAKQKHVAIRA